jgi:hypothetical protein
MSTEACEHEWVVTDDPEYTATCSKCGKVLPCEFCGWPSACILVVGECIKERNEAR